MGWMTPEQAARWYARSTFLYAFGVWTMIGGVVVPYMLEVRRREGRPEHPFSDEELKHLDKNAVWVSHKAPLGFTVSFSYRWNFINPRGQLYETVNPSSATSDGSNPTDVGN